MHTNFSNILIFMAAIFGVLFFIKILQLFLSKPSKLPPSEDHHDHLFFDDDSLDFDE